MNGQELFGGYTARPITGERFSRRKKAGLTGDDYADILKSKAFLKMDPLQQIEIRKIIQETKGLKAEEFRKSETHREEIETQKRARELEDNIRTILASDRTPAQKAIALWVNLGIPKKQANAMVWGERPEGEAEERVPTRRERKLAAIERGEDVTGRPPGTLIGKPPTERFPVWSTPEDIAAAREHAKGLREAETARREGRITRMGERQVERAAIVERERTEVKEALAARYTEVDKLREGELERVRAIRKAEEDKRTEETTAKMTSNFIDGYRTRQYTKTDLIGLLSGLPGISPSDAVNMTGDLPSEWDKKVYKDEQLKAHEKKLQDRIKDTRKYRDEREKVEYDRLQTEREETKEKADADAKYKLTLLDRTYNWVGLMRDLGFDAEDFVQIVPQFLSILDPSQEEADKIAKALGTTSDIVTKNTGEIMAEFGKQFKVQCGNTEGKFKKEGLTDRVRDECEFLAILAFEHDVKETDFNAAKKKWQKAISEKGWYFGSQEVPFESEELTNAFLEQMSKEIGRQDVENLMDRSASWLDEKSARRAKELIKPEKEGVDLEAQLPDELRTAMSTLGEGERLDAMQALRTGFDEKTKRFKEPRGTRMTEGIEFVIGMGDEIMAKPREEYPVNLGYGDYIATVLASTSLEEATKGWLIVMRSKPEWWQSVIEQAELYGTIPGPGDEAERVDIGERIGGALRKVGEKIVGWLDWGTKEPSDVVVPDVAAVVEEIRRGLPPGSTKKDLVEAVEKRGISKEELFAIYPNARP